jgi:glycosyltransferase involved in cell wall biosynthesis
MRKIKVIHIVHDFMFGGIEAFLFYLSQAQLSNENLEISILCCQDKDLVSNKRLQNTNVKIHYVKIFPFDLRISRYKKIIKIVNNYDVIHVHIFKPILSIALKYSNTKILYTNHSAGIIGRSNSLSFKIKNKLLVNFLNKNVDGITNNSNFTKKFWIDQGVKNKNNWVIYNGILFNEKVNFNRPYEEHPIIKNKFIVGTSSRFIPWKRIDYLMEAFDIFQKNKPDVNLLLVGDGEIAKSLELKAKKMDSSNKIIFTGFKTSVTDYQSVFHVCVFPSHSEPFGLVAVECLHLGKPVMVFNDGGGLTEILNKIEEQNIVNSKEELVQRLENEYDKFNLKQTDPMIPKRINYSENYNIFNIESQFYTVYQNLLNDI